MTTDERIKESVKQKYGDIARGELAVLQEVNSCCSGGGASSSCCTPQADVPQGSDLGLGCGTPTAFADLTEGMTVLDLGSGAGVDCFIAAQYVGATGRVIGVDMTPAMIERANANKARSGASTIEFRLGEIEALPVEDATVDRIISNCVINLVPDKSVAFREMHRVLKPGGAFTISDIVVEGDISEEERRDAALWAGCISGALRKQEYLDAIARAGFRDVQVVAETPYEYTLRSGAHVLSITVKGWK